MSDIEDVTTNQSQDQVIIEDDDMIDFSEIVLSVLTTEDGESITNVLQGLRDAMDKQNKILYKISTLLGAK